MVTSMLEWSKSAHRLKFIFGEYCLFSISFRAVELATPVTRLGDCLDRSAAAALPFLGRYGAVAIPSHPISAAPGRLKMSRGLLRYVSEITVHYFVEPGGSFDEYFSQRPRRYRHELLRKLRRFADAAEIDLRVYRSPDESKAFYPIALAISGKTYQRRLLDVGLPEAAGFKAELSARAGCGASRGYLLFHRETAIAYAYATVAGDHLRFRWIGYDPAYGALSPGTILICEALRSAIGECRFSLIDFGAGEAQYKRVFATASLRSATVFLFRPTVRNFLIVAAHRCCVAASDGCVFVLTRLGIKERVKRRLRISRSERRRHGSANLALWASSAGTVYAAAGAVAVC